MEDFNIIGEESFIALLRYRLECRNRRVIGKVIEGNKTFLITQEGKYWIGNDGFPDLENEFDGLISSLAGF